MTFSRTVSCHYSFMHENLLDMNHQFLHRGVVGRIKPTLLGYDTGPDSVEARYLFTHAGGKKNRGAGLLASKGVGGSSSPDVITIRTGYPYQTLKLVPQDADLPAFSLWVAYVPEDAEQRTNHVYGLLMIEKPPVPGLIHLAWPLIRRFTERVFAEDRMAVEAEQRAWDEQGEDWNHEVFPLIMDVRHVLRSNGVPSAPHPPCAVPPRSAVAQQQQARHHGPKRRASSPGRRLTAACACRRGVSAGGGSEMIGGMSHPDRVDFVQLTEPGQVAPGTRQALVDCWVEVANAGGAVGFAFPPVDAGQVGPAADRLIADLDPGYNRVLLAQAGGALAGWLNLSRHRDPLVPHWGTVERVQTRPAFRGRGIGVALMHEVRRIARDELGLEQLRLEARGGAGLEDFYGRLGWTEAGRWPAALRFPHGDRDEVLMLLAPL